MSGRTVNRAALPHFKLTQLNRAALPHVKLTQSGIDRDIRLSVLASQSAENAARAARPPRAQPGVAGCEAAGLVSSKTSRHDLFVNCSPSALAERRVNRLKRSVWASGHLHGIADHGKRAPQCWFVTLTYALADAWAPQHMSKAVEAFRNWCRRVEVPCRYTWVAEIQPRRLATTGKAVVHYHLLSWLPQGVRMPRWDMPPSRRARAFWTHGMTNTEKAKAGVGYLMKYLSKLGELTRFPKGLRLYGIGGLNQQGRDVRAWFNLPEWVKRSYGVGDIGRVRRGLVVRETGELLAPAFRVQFMHGGMVVHPLRELPDRFHDGAYSSVTFH